MGQFAGRDNRQRRHRFQPETQPKDRRRQDHQQAEGVPPAQKRAQGPGNQEGQNRSRGLRRAQVPRRSGLLPPLLRETAENSILAYRDGCLKELPLGGQPVGKTSQSQGFHNPT